MIIRIPFERDSAEVFLAARSLARHRLRDMRDRRARSACQYVLNIDGSVRYWRGFIC
jgi:hypothetical protein